MCSWWQKCYDLIKSNIFLLLSRQYSGVCSCTSYWHYDPRSTYTLNCLRRKCVLCTGGRNQNNTKYHNNIIKLCTILCIRDSAGKTLKNTLQILKFVLVLPSTCLAESCFQPCENKDKNTLFSLATTVIPHMPTLGIKPGTQMWKTSALPGEQTGKLGLKWLPALSSVLTSNSQKHLSYLQHDSVWY